MIEHNIQKLCYKLDLGKLNKPPKRVFGGLLHEMYKIETSTGAYAVKALNPIIMKRETAIKNYLFSEKVAKIACTNNIPVALAIEAENCLHQINGNYYMVFQWVFAKSLLPKEVTYFHCKTIGEILAKIHKIDFSQIEQSAIVIPQSTVTDWTSYLSTDAQWVTELSKIEHLLYEWEKEANRSANDIFTHQIISHRDMDCKNVLWDKYNTPIIIDWEAAGYINPLQELIDVAMVWAGVETADFDLGKFNTIIESYVNHGGIIADNVSTVLRFGYKGKLEWLEYNLKRSIGIESSNQAQQELGTAEVFNTIQTLKNYENVIPSCGDVMNRYSNR